MSKVQIFHTNDIHSQYNNLAKIASYLKSHRKQNSLLLDAGDFIDFSCKENYISQGKYGLSLLESCKYDAISIGNNEGFNSISIVEKLAKKSKVKFLSVNLKKKNHQDLKYIQSSFLITCNQIRFLIIGATPFAPSYNDYFHLYGFHSEEPYALIKNEIEKHQNQYDCVILLSHLGYRNDKILANSDLPIHLIIGGHSHTLLPLEKINKTYIHQVGVNGTYLGQIEVELKDKQLCIQAKEISMKNYHYHKDLLNEIQLQSLSLQSKLNQKLLQPSLGLKTSIYQENSLTNFLADCMLNEKKADFALINSGMASTHIHKGSFTYQDLLNVNKIELWKTEGYPKYWTAIYFTSSDIDLPNKLSKVMISDENFGGNWYVDFKHNNTKYIVFKDKILKYEIGNITEKKKVEIECKKLGILDISDISE